MRRVGEHRKTVGKALRDVHLSVVVAREFNGDGLTEGGRARADVERNVENSAGDDAHEFGLRMFSFLIMQTAQRAFERKRSTVLHELLGNADFVKCTPVVRLQKIASVVPEDGGLEYQDLCDGGGNDLHGF